MTQIRQFLSGVWVIVFLAPDDPELSYPVRLVAQIRAT